MHDSDNEGKETMIELFQVWQKKKSHNVILLPYAGFTLLYLHAAAVGGRTSVNDPPRIHGLEEAAATEPESMSNSKAVSWGFCPARLSRSCMSSSRLERAAQTCSSRLELEETWGRLAFIRLMFSSFCWEKLCCDCDVDDVDDDGENLLYSALSKTPLFRLLVPWNRPTRPPKTDGPSLSSTEVSVDSATLEARNWTCRRAVVPALLDQADISLGVAG